MEPPPPPVNDPRPFLSEIFHGIVSNGDGSRLMKGILITREGKTEVREIALRTEPQAVSGSTSLCAAGVPGIIIFLAYCMLLRESWTLALDHSNGIFSQTVSEIGIAGTSSRYIKLDNSLPSLGTSTGKSMVAVVCCIDHPPRTGAVTSEMSFGTVRVKVTYI